MAGCLDLDVVARFCIQDGQVSRRRIEAKAWNGSLLLVQSQILLERGCQIFYLNDKSAFSKHPVITMASSEYELLRQQDLDLGEKASPSSRLEQSRYMYKAACNWLVVLLFASLSINFIWVYRQLHTSTAEIDETPTIYGK